MRTGTVCSLTMGTPTPVPKLFLSRSAVSGSAGRSCRKSERWKQRFSGIILYDMYRMDAWLPPLFGKWTEDYKKASYSQWAVDELRDFIAEQIYPRREGSIEEFCKLTHEFMMKTAKYAMVNPNTSLMFRSASEMAANILDLLRAME